MYIHDHDQLPSPHRTGASWGVLKERNVHVETVKVRRDDVSSVFGTGRGRHKKSSLQSPEGGSIAQEVPVRGEWVRPYLPQTHVRLHRQLPGSDLEEDMGVGSVLYKRGVTPRDPGFWGSLGTLARVPTRVGLVS